MDTVGTNDDSGDQAEQGNGTTMNENNNSNGITHIQTSPSTGSSDEDDLITTAAICEEEEEEEEGNVETGGVERQQESADVTPTRRRRRRTPPRVGRTNNGNRNTGGVTEKMEQILDSMSSLPPPEQGEEASMSESTSAWPTVVPPGNMTLSTGNLIEEDDSDDDNDDGADGNQQNHVGDSIATHQLDGNLQLPPMQELDSKSNTMSLRTPRSPGSGSDDGKRQLASTFASSEEAMGALGTPWTGSPSRSPTSNVEATRRQTDTSTVSAPPLLSSSSSGQPLPVPPSYRRHVSSPEKSQLQVSATESSSSSPTDNITTVSSSSSPIAAHAQLPGAYPVVGRAFGGIPAWARRRLNSDSHNNQERNSNTNSGGRNNERSSNNSGGGPISRFASRISSLRSSLRSSSRVSSRSSASSRRTSSSGLRDSLSTTMMPVRRLFSSSIEGNHQNNNDHHIPPELRTQQYNNPQYHHSSHLDAIGEGNTNDNTNEDDDDDETGIVNGRISVCNCNNKGNEEENETTRRSRILLLRVGVIGIVVASIMVAIAITLTFVLDTDGGSNGSNLSDNNNTGKLPPLHPPPGLYDYNNNNLEGIPLSMAERRKMEHILDILMEYDIDPYLMTLPPTPASSSNSSTWFWKSSTPQQLALQWLATKDQYLSYDNDTEYDLSSFSRQIVQRYAMVVLYYSTNGRNTWYDTNDLNFLSTNTSICEWNVNSTSTATSLPSGLNVGSGSDAARRNNNGVWCDESGSVVNLYLDHAGLNGTLPSELSVLTTLEEFSVRFNNLRGTVPKELGKLTRLQEVHIVYSYVTGSIPNSFSDLRQLKVLHLSDNLLNGTIPTGLTKIESLNVLDLGINYLSGTIPSFSTNMDGLYFLSLGQNRLSGPLPPSLYSLTNLDYLGIGLNKLTGSISSHVGDLTALTTLDFDINDLSNTLPTEIGKLSNLVSLIGGSNLITGTIPSELAQLSTLETLSLFENTMSGTIPTQIATLERLSVINLFFNFLTGTLPKEFAAIPSLGFLDVGKNLMSFDAMEDFCKASKGKIEVGSDCAAVPPDVDCPCCVICHDRAGGVDVDHNVLCELDEVRLTMQDSNEMERGTTCSCMTDDDERTSLHCSETCQSCNINGTVCAVVDEFKRTYDNEGLRNSELVTYRYQATGSRDEVTFHNEWILNDEDIPFWHCTVSVNGNKCLQCNKVTCRDGFSAYSVLCDNVDGVGNYYPCGENADEDGPLAVFALQDPLLLESSGCLPMFNQILESEDENLYL